MATTTEALSVALSAVPTDSEGYAVGGTTSGTRRSLLLRYLHDYAGGQCVCCGEPAYLNAGPSDITRAEGGHLIPAGTERGGYFPGNLGLMCRYCNARLGNRDARTFLAGFRNVEGIPLEWPSWGELERRYGPPNQNAEKAERDIICRSIGF